MGRVFRLDFGVSLGLQIDVWDIIKGRLGATVQLGVGGWLIAVLMGIPTGVIAAVWRGGIFDYLARFVALVGQAAPAFVTGIVMICLFSVNLQAISEDSPYAFLRIFAMPAGGRTPDELRWKGIRSAVSRIGLGFRRRPNAFNTIFHVGDSRFRVRQDGKGERRRQHDRDF